MEYQLPVLQVRSETSGEAWIKALQAVWHFGKEMPHHYTDELSKEALVTLVVSNPLKEPRIHPADYVGTSSIKLTPTYVKEVLEGTLDQKVDEGTLSYTYHRRLRSWGKKVKKHEELLKKLNKIQMKLYIPRVDPYSSADEPRIMEIESILKDKTMTYIGIDQVENMIQKAIEEPISRKLQMTTWMPHKDLFIKGAPCLQRVWFRIVPKNKDEFEGIVMHTSWRSRDLFKGVGSNIYGMVELGQYVCKRIERGLEMPLKFLQYIDTSSSIHIYKSDYDTVLQIFEVLKKRRERLEGIN